MNEARKAWVPMASQLWSFAVLFRQSKKPYNRQKDGYSLTSTASKHDQLMSVHCFMVFSVVAKTTLGWQQGFGLHTITTMTYYI